MAICKFQISLSWPQKESFCREVNVVHAFMIKQKTIENDIYYSETKFVLHGITEKKLL